MPGFPAVKDVSLVPIRHRRDLTFFASGQKSKQNVKNRVMKRPALVLSSEGAGHPFRRSLPPHFLADTAYSAESGVGDNDWKLFALSFLTFFTAFYSFIA